MIPGSQKGSPSGQRTNRDAIAPELAMRFGWLAALTAFCLVVAGCQQPNRGVGGWIAPPVKKIVSLSPSTTEVIGALNVYDKLVGRTTNCDYPPGVKSAVVVVDGTKPNFEKIATIAPDLIVYDKKLYPNTDLEKLKEVVKKPDDILVMDVDSIDQLMDYMLLVGSRTGSVSRASEVCDQIYSAREAAIANAPNEKVRVAVITGGAGQLLAAGQDSFLADVVKSCGGEMVGPAGKVFSPFSAEALVKGDPEIILTDDKPESILGDPRLATVNAVRSKPHPRVYQVDPGVLLRTAPRVKDLLDNLSNAIRQAATARSN